jgi:type I restriction enzyme S subunit
MNSEVREPSAKYLVMQGAQRPDLGWRNLPLGHVLKFQRGFDLPHRVRREGAIPVVSSAGVTDFHDEAAVLPPGVVTGRYGTIGQLFYLEERFWPLNTTLYVRDFQGNDPKFIYYLLHSFDFGAFSGKSGVPGVNRNDLHAELVSIPRCVEEQRAIATALSDVDALIAGLERLIAKKRNIKQATMQQLLTSQTRLPGFSGEWRDCSLGQIADIKTGRRNNEDKVEDGAYPFFVRSANVERINTYSHDCEAILVPGEGQIGSIFHYVNGRFDVHQRVYAITQFTDGISGRFVHLFMSQHFGAWAMQNTVKATVDSLRLPTFQTFEMRVPPTLEEQTAIATVLSDMDAELSALEVRRNKTRDLKQAMMLELLTGRTRLV